MTGAQSRLAQWRLTGQIQLDLPPEEAFALFTPRGEQDWAHGWHPRFPVPADDDTEPGTVFETDAHQQTGHGQRTVWVVTDRQPGVSISYARVTPGWQAGTVTITVSAASGHSQVEVSYRLTALTDEAAAELSQFAEGYPAYLRSWQDAITAATGRRTGIRIP